MRDGLVDRRDVLEERLAIDGPRHVRRPSLVQGEIEAARRRDREVRRGGELRRPPVDGLDDAHADAERRRREGRVEIVRVPGHEVPATV